MAGPRKLQKGTRIAGIPADSWNAFVDATKRINQMPGIPNSPAHSSKPDEQVQVLVQNKTGAALTERFPILSLGDPVVTPADITDAAQVVLRGVQFEAAAPDSSTKSSFVVMQGPCGVDEFRPATLAGATYCKVDVTDSSHTHATSVLNDVAKLVSGTSGARILWKDAGTGVKWAVVLMGVDATINIVHGRAVGAVSGGTFDIDQIELMNGVMPSGVDEASADTITLLNPFGLTLIDNELARGVQADDGTWIATHPSTGAPEEVIYFELTQDKAYADAAKLAKPVDAAGAIVSGADAFYVVDDQRQYYGKAAVGAEEGYRGHAWKFTDDYTGGVPGYRIIDMEGPAHLLVGVLNGSYSLGGTPFTPSVDQPWGRPSRGRRLPATGDITVFDDLVVAEYAKNGDKWLIAFDEAEAHYIFLEPLGNPYITIKGTAASTVTRASTSFTLSSPVSVNGPVPSGTIIVSCDPKIDCPSGTEIYARFNVTKGDGTLQQAWDTGDTHNHEWIMRGYPQWAAGSKLIFTSDAATLEWNTIADVLNWLAGYTAGNNQSIGHDSSDVTKWQDDGTACP